MIERARVGGGGEGSRAWVRAAVAAGGAARRRAARASAWPYCAARCSARHLPWAAPRRRHGAAVKLNGGGGGADRGEQAGGAGPRPRSPPPRDQRHRAGARALIAGAPCCRPRGPLLHQRGSGPRSCSGRPLISQRPAEPPVAAELQPRCGEQSTAESLIAAGT